MSKFFTHPLFFAIFVEKYFVLENLITSKTRIKMLLKFFTNSHATAYLRSMADEFGESTNSIRHELNNLSKAGYLTSKEEGRTILYQANTNHPLYDELKSLVHKYLGLDKIIDNILRRIGELELAFVIGDYAKGIDSGTIELLLVGEIDKKYLSKLVVKAKQLMNRNIKINVLRMDEYLMTKENYSTALVLWNSSTQKA